MKSSGAMFTDAVAWCECPRCHRPAGQSCVTPSNRPAKFTHGERLGALVAHPGYRLSNYQIGAHRRIMELTP